MVIAVSVGVGLAALMFMRRMAETTQTRLAGYTQPRRPRHRRQRRAPPSPMPCAARSPVYEIAGPLFFGAAQRAMSSLGAVAEAGGGALSSASTRCRRWTRPAWWRWRARSRSSRRTAAWRSWRDCRPEPQALLEKAQFQQRPWRLIIRPDLASAIAAAEGVLGLATASETGEKTLVDLPRV